MSSLRTTPGSLPRPMTRGARLRSLVIMELKLWILALGLLLLVLALGGWAVDGLRWALRGGAPRRLAGA